MRHFRTLLALYAGVMAARDAAAAGRPRILPPPKLFENHQRIDLAPEGTTWTAASPNGRRW